MKQRALTLWRRPSAPRWSFAVLAASVLLTAGPLRAQDRLAITGATIIPISGERIENGTILISDGRIEAVGADVDVPVEAKVIDASGQFVMPGIIDAHSHVGIRVVNESTDPNTGMVAVGDAIEHESGVEACALAVDHSADAVSVAGPNQTVGRFAIESGEVTFAVNNCWCCSV